MKSTLALLVLLTAVSPANAFDVWGFRSGMSVEQATATAERQGYSTHAWDAQPGARYKTFTYSTAADPTAFIAGFCDGRLVWLSHDYKSTMVMLFDLLDDLKKNYGTPTVQTYSQLVAQGQVRSVNFNFPPKPADVPQVGINLTLDSDNGFNIQVMHSTARAVCPN
ncbi:MAG TPA: hypothetical protein VMT66_12220 [Steroidobacteraceae bacterium]|nr:hypothetical protein [Steroidobacteraceae bacterium]